MKEWFEFIGKNIVTFVPTFGSLINSPSQRLSELVLEDPEPLKRALAFVGFAIAIGLVIQISWLPPKADFLLVAAGRVAHKVVVIGIYAYVLYRILHFMGGKGSFDATLAGYLYVTSLIYLTAIVLNILKIGVLGLEGLRDAWLEHHSAQVTAWATSGNSPTQVAYRCLSAAPLLTSAAWIAAFWNGFIRIHGIHSIGRWKSVAGYLVTIVVFGALLGVIFLFSQALYGRDFPLIY